MLHHVLEESAPLLRNSPVPAPFVLAGASGVDIFFVISGFIMLSTAFSRFGEPGAGRRFLARRLTRIAPLYWLCTSAILMAHVSGILYGHIVVSPASVIGSFLFVDTGHQILGAGWTLNYEMWFYLVFACFLFLRSTRTAVCVIVGTLLLAAFFASLHPATPFLRFLANPISIEFCYGLAVALIYSRSRPASRAIRVTSFLAGLAGIALGSALAPHLTTAGIDAHWRWVAWGVPACLLVFSLIACTTPKNVLGKILLLLGDASYSLYLTHSIVMTAYARIIKTGRLDGQNVYLVIAAVLLISVSVGLVTYHLLEKRIDALARRTMCRTNSQKEEGTRAARAA